MYVRCVFLLLLLWAHKHSMMDWESLESWGRERKWWGQMTSTCKYANKKKQTCLPQTTRIFLLTLSEETVLLYCRQSDPVHLWIMIVSLQRFIYSVRMCHSLPIFVSKKTILCFNVDMDLNFCLPLLVTSTLRHYLGQGLFSCNTREHFSCSGVKWSWLRDDRVVSRLKTILSGSYNSPSYSVTIMSQPLLYCPWISPTQPWPLCFV